MSQPQPRPTRAGRVLLTAVAVGFASTPLVGGKGQAATQRATRAANVDAAAKMIDDADGLIVRSVQLATADQLNSLRDPGTPGGLAVAHARIGDMPHELIVRFRDVPTPAHLAAVRDQFPAIVGWRSLRHAPHPRNDPSGVHPLAFVRVATLGRGSDGDALAMAQRLAAVSRVPIVHAEPNERVSIATDATRQVSDDPFKPDDPLYSQQWGPQKIDAPGAWQATRGDSEVVIAVVDTGLCFDHEDFQEGAVWINTAEVPDNGIDDDENGFIDDVVGWDFIDDDNWPEPGDHGTAVSGVLGARLNNGLGVAGLANVRIMVLEALGPWTSIIAATYYAVDMEADAINFSLAGGEVEEMRLAVEYAREQNVTTVGGAGNDGVGGLAFPAAFPSVIAVGATEHDDTRWSRSNYGPELDVVAPGVDIVSTAPVDDGSYLAATGTSMSAPHVTGLVALMYSVDPTVTVAEVQGLIRASADDVGKPGFDEFTGYGRINARRTLRAVMHALACPADVDGDNRVGFSDLVCILDQWGSSDWQADIDDDGVVDFDDLALVLAAWGTCE